MEVRATIVLYPGVDDLDVFGPFEVLANAARAGALIDVALLGAHDDRPLRTSHGATVVPDGVLGESPLPTVLVVPGGGWNDRAAAGARTEADRGVLPAAIAQLHAQGVTIASVCTGAGLVAATGLLRGRPVSTHRGARDDLAAAGAEVLDARVLDDGDIVSAGGVTSGIDLALYLLESWFGAPLADDIAREIEYTRQGPVVRGPGHRTGAGAARPPGVSNLQTP